MQRSLVLPGETCVHRVRTDVNVTAGLCCQIICAMARQERPALSLANTALLCRLAVLSTGQSCCMSWHICACMLQVGQGTARLCLGEGAGKRHTCRPSCQACKALCSRLHRPSHMQLPGDLY